MERVTGEIDVTGIVLREKYFLAMLCERATCGYVMSEFRYKYCPQCGHPTMAIYDYYALFSIPSLPVCPEGGVAAYLRECRRKKINPYQGAFLDLELLKRNYRKLVRYYHPDMTNHNRAEAAVGLSATTEFEAVHCNAPTHQVKRPHHVSSREMGDDFNLGEPGIYASNVSAGANDLRRDYSVEGDSLKNNAVRNHDNFLFLTTGLETLTNVEHSLAYYNKYRSVKVKMEPHLAALIPKWPQMTPPTEADGQNDNQALTERINRFIKQILTLAVFMVDLMVVAGVIFLVWRTYLLGAVVSLGALWFYFKQTRKFLKRFS